MAFWGLAAGVFGLVMAFAALTAPIARRHLPFVTAVAYLLVALGSATLTNSLWVNLLVPGGLLLFGYWLSGSMFGPPQAWLETWLLATDRAIGADRWMHRLPRPLAELLEASYACDYLVVGGGAIYAATAGTEAVVYYWSLVLTSELASFAPLPWLRSRPPRTLKGGPLGPPEHAPGPPEHPPGPSIARRLNLAILNSASIQANTLPSGHVSGAVAAALGVLPLDATIGWTLMAIAGLIAVAAVAGRYHYVVDCVAGAAVSLLVWSLV